MDLHGLVTSDNGLDDLISFVGFQYTFPNRKPELQKKNIRAKTRVSYPQLCNFGPSLFHLIESLMLHVFASICGMELTRQMSLSSKERKLTNRPREDWLGNHARTIRYQCGNVCFWPLVDTILIHFEQPSRVKDG